MLQRSDFFKSQHQITDFIKKNERCAIWSFMGSGKTAATETAFLDLHESLDTSHLLVFAPLRVARKVWRDEIQEWAHLKGLTIQHIVGDPKQRNRAMRTRAHIHTINRENTVWLSEQFLQGNKLRMRWPWDMVAIDESQSYKSCDAERWKAMKRLRKLFPRLVELTGTQAPNGLHDLWGQYFLLDDGRRLGAKVTAFRDRWFDCVRNTEGYAQWVPRETAEKEIYKLVADITLSLEEKDHFDRPAVPIIPVRIELSPQTMAKYKFFERQKLLEVDGKIINAVNSGALAGKLLQLANGAVYDKTGAWHEFHQEKLDALIETIEFMDKAIIAYSYVHDLERSAARLDKFCKQTGKTWVILKSDSDLARWGRGEFDFGIIHPATGGHGLNDIYKSGCKHIVWFGLTNNLEYFQQLNARLAGGHRRSGEVTIFVIVCDNTYDARQLPLLSKKAAVQSDLGRAVADYRKEVLNV